MLPLCARLSGAVARAHLDAHLHAHEGFRRAEIDAVQRDSLTRIAGDGNADQIARADDAAGRVELDPARTRQIDLHPGMRRAAAAVTMVVAGEEIARDEARGDAEPAQRLDHQ